MYRSPAKGVLAGVLEEGPSILGCHGPFQQQRGENVWLMKQAPTVLHHRHCSVQGHQHLGDTLGTPSVLLRNQAIGRPVDIGPIDFLRLKQRPGHAQGMLMQHSTAPDA